MHVGVGHGKYVVSRQASNQASRMNRVYTKSFASAASDAAASVGSVALGFDGRPRWPPDWYLPAKVGTGDPDEANKQPTHYTTVPVIILQHVAERGKSSVQARNSCPQGGHMTIASLAGPKTKVVRRLGSDCLVPSGQGGYAKKPAAQWLIRPSMGASAPSRCGIRLTISLLLASPLSGTEGQRGPFWRAAPMRAACNLTWQSIIVKPEGDRLSYLSIPELILDPPRLGGLCCSRQTTLHAHHHSARSGALPTTIFSALHVLSQEEQRQGGGQSAIPLVGTQMKTARNDKRKRSRKEDQIKTGTIPRPREDPSHAPAFMFQELQTLIMV